jgi:hypothetical protein
MLLFPGLGRILACGVAVGVGVAVGLGVGDSASDIVGLGIGASQSSSEADRLAGYMQFPNREGQQSCFDDFSATTVSPRFPEKAVFSQNSNRDKRNDTLAHEAK